MHLGSLLAAVGSFLDARSRGGRWLVRIEDLDRARVVPGSAAEILRTLEAFGLHWDGEVEYQSRRTHLYAEAVESLRAAGRTFECSCSRRELSVGEPTQEASARAWMRGPGALPPGTASGTASARAEMLGPGALPPGTASGTASARAEMLGPGALPPGTASGTAYPGTCREGPRRAGDTATRFRIDETETVAFEDRFQGPIALSLRNLGDVIVQRRDGVFAYQIAVVVDDASQGITDVVRGADLLESTGWQIALQRALRLAVPRHAHLPLLLERIGGKLSKSRRAPALDADRAGAQVLEALKLLGLSPPADHTGASAASLLQWAASHWSERPARLPRQIVLE